MSRTFSVLLVEDDDPLRSVLCDLLQQWGCVVHATDQGQQALDFVRSEPIDFSILDMHLPGTNGIEVFRAIRREVGTPLPAILISGGATAEDAKRALEVGMFRFLQKPLDAQVLRHCLDTLVAQHFGIRRPPGPPLG